MRKVKNTEITAEERNKEFFEAVKLLEEQKGIPADYMFEKIKAAITSATRNTYQNRDIVVCEIDPEKQTMRVYVKKNVVEEIGDSITDLTLEQARNYDANAQIGSTVEIPLETKNFGRIVAQTAKSVIRQGIREAERELANKEFASRHHEVVTAKVISTDLQTGDARIEIGRATAILPKADQIPGEELKPDQLVKVYVASISEEKGTSYASISRKHPGLVKRLFETEVPEIYDGTVEIISVSREAGSRTKIAVKSNDENVDPVGACIGPKGARVANVVETLCGEKIDVIKYSDDPAEYIAGALAPSSVISVTVDPEGARTCMAVVPDTQLSLAIGNKGQNVRLAAKLTGWKIDIKSESQI